MAEALHPNKADTAFQRFLAARNLDAEQLSVRAGMDAMFAFYELETFSPLADGDPDMLLFQWGTYDWGEGPSFEIDITRQLIWPCGGESEDHEIWQLSLTFRFEPNDELELLGKGNRWCEGREELPALKEYLGELDAYQSVADRADAEVDIEFSSVE